jgi:hypothetical protein
LQTTQQKSICPLPQKPARVECHRLARCLVPAAVADTRRELVSEILRVANSKIDIALCKAYE